MATGLGAMLAPGLPVSAEPQVGDLPGVPVEDGLPDVQPGEKILGRSYCAGCSLACPVAWVAAEGEPESRRLVIDRRRSSADAGLCIRGLTAGVTLTAPSRIDRVRYRGPRADRWQTIEWSEAVQRISRRIRDSVGAIRWDIGSVLTCEETLAAAMLARATGGAIHSSIDPGFDTWYKMVGRGEDPRHSAASPENWVGRDLIILIGSDLAVSHATATARLLRAKQRGAKVVVVDSRFTRTATLADLHIRPLPGSDPLLLRALLRAIEHRPEQISLEGTAVPPADFRRLAELVKQQNVSTARGVAIVFGSGVTQRRTASHAIAAALDLQKAIGGRMDHVAIIGGEPNLRGTARVLAANVSDESKQDAERDTRGMFVIGRNPAVGYHAASQTLPMLDRLKWLVVADLFETETAGFWHRPDVDPKQNETEVFLLPARHALEKSGRMIATGGPVDRQPLFDPPEHSRSDLWIIDRIGTLATLGSERSEIDEGEPRLQPYYADRFAELELEDTGNGEGEATPPDDDLPVPIEPADFDGESQPVLAYFARMGELGHGGCFSRNSTYLLELVHGPFLEISREAAKRRGIKRGDLVRVESNRCSVEVPAMVTDRVCSFQIGGEELDTICLVGHFGAAGLRPAADLFQIAPSEDRPTVCRLSVVPQPDPWGEI